MNFKILGLTLLSMGTFSVSAHAQLLNFDFTFVGNPNDSTVNGTVSGEIIGLQNNASSIPSDIILTAIPLGLGITATASTPYSLKDNGWNLSGDAEGASFTVSAGAITSSTDYEASLSSDVAFFSLDIPLVVDDVEMGPLNGFQYDSNFVANHSGFAGVTYAPVAVPEPGEYALLLVSTAVLFAGRRFFRAKHSV